MTIRAAKATKIALAAALLLGTVGGLAGRAEAQAPRYDRDGRFDYGRNGPNTSYMAGPRTRVYVTKRSWLDAGTEVLPGERKFTDYAYPPGQSFGRQNLNRPIDRQPLSPPSDFGFGDNYYGDLYQGRFPLY
jgi:hypothetical protein